MKVDLDSIKKNLMIKYPLFGSVIANTKFVEDKSILTGGTDGEIIYYNPTFLTSLNEKEQTFVFAHEICHIAFDHIYRSEGKDTELWNIATDAVVNALLQQDGLPLLESCVNISEAINYNAEQMYEKLLKEKQQKQNNNQGKSKEKKNNNSNNNQGNGQSNDSSQSNNTQQNNSQDSNDQKDQNSQGNGQSNDSNQSNNTQQNNSQNLNDQKDQNNQGNGSEGQDDSNPIDSQSGSSSSNNHSLWEKALEKRNNKNSDSKDETKKNKKNENVKDKVEQGKKDKEEHIKKLSSAGETESFRKNKIARKKQLEELMNSIADKSHRAGTETNRDIREVGKIGATPPLIDWRKLLKEAIKFDVDWSYENATVENGIVTAHLEELPQPETEIVLDTSGSIDNNLLKNFLRECKNILQTSKVKVGCFDVEFYGFTEIRNIRDIDKMKFKGGGGTDFDVAVNAFTRRVENKIIFTDGEADMPNKPIDAIWVVFGNVKIQPKGGKVIYINEEQLRKLNSFNNKR